MKIVCHDKLHNGNWMQKSKELENHGRPGMTMDIRIIGVNCEEVNRVDWCGHVKRCDTGRSNLSSDMS